MPPLDRVHVKAQTRVCRACRSYHREQWARWADQKHSDGEGLVLDLVGISSL